MGTLILDHRIPDFSQLYEEMLGRSMVLVLLAISLPFDNIRNVLEYDNDYLIIVV